MTRCFKWLLLFTSLMAACSSTTGDGPATCPGGGEVLEVEADAICVYRSEIIETGFQCPAERATRTDYGDLVVCSDGDPPPGTEDELGEAYPWADLDNRCANVICGAGETCVDGNCVSGNNENNENNDNDDTCVPTAEVCDDGIDNDCDGDVDCDDSDCADAEACSDPPACDDPFEPNDTPETASDGAPADSKLCDADDVDHWAVPDELAGGDQFSFIVTLPQQMSMTAELVTTDGEPVYSETGEAIAFDSTNNVSDGLFVGDAIVRRGSAGPFVLALSGDRATDYRIELTATAIPKLDGITGVGAGDDFSCALDGTGTVYCWGSNDNLTLGDRAAPEFATPLSMTTMLAATDLFVGPEHACILSGTTPYCWGENSRSELGMDTSGDPSGLLVTNSLSGATELALGRDFTCALVGAEVQCWGSNAAGQLGDPTFIGSESATPVTVAGIDDAQELVAGDAFACVRRADDTVWCWGSDSNDQLYGTDTFDGYSATAVPIENARGDGTLTAVSLDAAAGWICAHQSNGIAWCWGDSKPNLGPGMGTIPVTAGIYQPPAADETIIGPSAWCRIEASRVACMGDGVWTQNPIRLGGDESASYLNDNTSYGIVVKDLDPTSALAIGANHMCAVEDENVICWGLNGRGQLGNGTTAPASWPVYVHAPN